MLDDCPLVSFCPLPVSSMFDFTYMFSNESDTENTLSKLASMQSLSSKNLHIGFAFWFNFSLIAKKNSAYAIICDIDPGINLLFECLRDVIIISPNREIFLENYIQKLKTKNFISHINYIFDEINLRKKFLEEKQNSNSWLSDEKHFMHIKNLFMCKKIICRELDLKDSVSVQSLLIWLNQKNSIFELDTFYTSNIYEWLENDTPETRESFQKNIGFILKFFPKTIVIDAFYKYQLKRNGFGPPQRIFKGCMPSYEKEKRSPFRERAGNELPPAKKINW